MKVTGQTVLCLLVSAIFASSSAAVVYEPEPPHFCQGETVHDYLKPFERMPKLHGPPNSGQIGFGPRSLRLNSDSQLQVGSGSIGYWLYPRQRKPMQLRWTVTTTFTEVNGNGRPIGKEKRSVRSLSQLNPAKGVSLEIEVSGRPALYKGTIVFRRASGQKLGGFGSYFRVVRPTRFARLAINAQSYRSETIVFSRVENFGTLPVFYGVPYSIERLESGSWSKAPESPKGPWIMPLLISGPGLAGRCNGFWIPPSMLSGQYRVTKRVGMGEWLPRKTKAARTLTAEFQVAP